MKRRIGKAVTVSCAFFALAFIACAQGGKAIVASSLTDGGDANVLG